MVRNVDGRKLLGGEGFQRVEIHLLTPGLFRIAGAGNWGSVIFDGQNLVCWLEQMTT